MTAGLYDRLGGAAVVAAFVDDAVDRHAANPALAARFCGKDLPQLKAVDVSVFSARLGGPCSTDEVGPPTSDAAFSFSPTELQAVVGDLTAALGEQGIGPPEIEEIVSLLCAVRQGPSCC